MSSNWITKVAHVVWENVEGRIPPEDTPLLLLTKRIGSEAMTNTRYFIANYCDETWWDGTLDDTAIEDMDYAPLFFARLPESP